MAECCIGYTLQHTLQGFDLKSQGMMRHKEESMRGIPHLHCFLLHFHCFHWERQSAGLRALPPSTISSPSRLCSASASASAVVHKFPSSPTGRAAWKTSYVGKMWIRLGVAVCANLERTSRLKRFYFLQGKVDVVGLLWRRGCGGMEDE